MEKARRIKKRRNRIFLVEDHDEALGIWRKERIRSLDLVHMDAHIDFEFHRAEPIEKVFKEARSLKELKRGLEHTVAFLHYEKDFAKQCNIGNYVYPAMEEGIVKDFYWVVPGGLKEFREAGKFLRDTIKGLLRGKRESQGGAGAGIIVSTLLGRKFIVCTLESLPVLKQNVLLDIDTDFLVIKSPIDANKTARIGKRKPWIAAQDLVAEVKKRIKRAEVITIADSVKGGWNQIKYRYLGDEMAYHFAPGEFKRRFQRSYQAAKYFDLFLSGGKKEYYAKAARLNSRYRVADNSYGPLYLSLRKFSAAEDEFRKVLRVDPGNPACLLGLGNVALGRRDFQKAKKCFASALNSGNHRLFAKVRKQSLLGLAEAEFRLKNLSRAKELLCRYQAIESLNGKSHYLLARIFEKEKDFEEAAIHYKDAIRLGFDGLEPMSRLVEISCHLKEKRAIITYVGMQYGRFKKGSGQRKRLIWEEGKRVRGLGRIEEKMAAFEKRLRETREEC